MLSSKQVESGLLNVLTSLFGFTRDDVTDCFAIIKGTSLVCYKVVSH